MSLSAAAEAGAKTTQAANDLGASSCSNSSFDGVSAQAPSSNINTVGVGNLLGWISGSSHYSPSYCSEGTRPLSINQRLPGQTLMHTMGLDCLGVFWQEPLVEVLGIATGLPTAKQDCNNHEGTQASRPSRLKKPKESAPIYSQIS